MTGEGGGGGGGGGGVGGAWDSKRGVIDGRDGGAPVAHLTESGTKHPSGWVILVIVENKSESISGFDTKAICFKPGSMEGPAGKQLAI